MPQSIDTPPALLTLRTRPLFSMQLDVTAVLGLGGPDGAAQRLGVIPRGRFEGERLSGKILDGGTDWQTLRSDDATILDARLALETEDGALIAMAYHGLRHGPAEVMERMARGETIDPADYYFRVTPTFTTSAPHYGWLNKILAVGIGHRIASGPIYSIFEIL